MAGVFVTLSLFNDEAMAQLASVQTHLPHVHPEKMNLRDQHHLHPTLIKPDCCQGVKRCLIHALTEC